MIGGKSGSITVGLIGLWLFIGLQVYCPVGGKMARDVFQNAGSANENLLHFSSCSNVQQRLAPIHLQVFLYLRFFFTFALSLTNECLQQWKV